MNNVKDKTLFNILFVMTFMLFALALILYIFAFVVVKNSEYNNEIIIVREMTDVSDVEYIETIQEDTDDTSIIESFIEYVFPEFTWTGSGLNRESGVNYYNGRKETYYSSNVLYHYMTPQWILGSDGVYRDSDGYVVVAASDIPYGSLVDTSLGMGKVYDCGCSPGTTDVYVAW